MITGTTAPFQESQKLSLVWICLAFAVVAFMVIRVVTSAIDAIPVTASDWTGLCISTILALLLAVLRLDILIDHEGIKYRWHPFFQKYTVIPWAKIETTTIRSFSALAEFGGWGLRYNFHETAYIMSGNDGIELKLKNKKRLFMLGTQQPALARQAISQYTQH
jgi:hypothetical protein